MSIRNLLFSFLYGLFAAAGAMMVFLGLLFFRSIMTSSPLCGQGVFTMLLFGIVLLLTGGGVLSSTIAQSYRKLRHKS